MKKILLSVSLALSSIAMAGNMSIPMSLLANNQTIGTIDLADSPYGLVLTPHLHGLLPGLHGFHLHENPTCANFGAASGDHFDPMNTKQHLGPYNPQGELGDLPILIVNIDGTATIAILAPRLTVAKVINHSLVIKKLGDNYSDHPAKGGGGGENLACGVVKAIS